MAQLTRSSWSPETLEAGQLEAIKNGDAEVFFLPDRLNDSGDQRLAGFRAEVQGLQAELHNQGIKAMLSAPAGYRKSPYSEHSADWVLPTILVLAGIPVEVLSGLIVERLTRAAAEDPGLRVRYREIDFEREDERFELVEVEGTAGEVAKLLEERSDSSTPD